MKARNFKSDRHLAYAQRKRDKAQARRKDYVKGRNMLANGQKRSNVIDFGAVLQPVQRFGAMGMRKAA